MLHVFFWRLCMLICIICNLCCNSSVFTFSNTSMFMVCCGKKDVFTKKLVPAISQELFAKQIKHEDKFWVNINSSDLFSCLDNCLNDNRYFCMVWLFTYHPLSPARVSCHFCKSVFDHCCMNHLILVKNNGWCQVFLLWKDAESPRPIGCIWKI